MIGVTSNPVSYIKIEGPRAYITQWQVLSAGETITIPTSEYSSLVVDWGDGVNEVITTGSDIAHQYADAGIYTVQITWEAGRIRFNNTGDKDKILDVTQWGSCEWTSCQAAYRGAINCLFSAADTPDFSQVTSMEQMFEGATNANPITTNWDTSSVLDVNSMFLRATNANPDVSGWNTSNVTNMAFMFDSATSADPDTTNWNTANVERMQGMFNNTIVADPETSNWDTSNVVNMSQMFKDSSIATPNTTSWDTGKVENMSEMFRGATSANPNTTTWDTGKVENMQSMFQSATSADPDVSGWNTSNVVSMFIMFRSATIANPDVSNWDTEKVENIGLMFEFAINANPDLSNWDFSQLTSASNFANGSAFSTANYEAFLANAAGQTLQPNVAFHAGNAQYNGGTPTLNKQEIENLRNWTFTDGGRIVKEYTTEWQTTSNQETITIPTSDYSTLEVDWGDGSTETISSGGSISHEYSTAGVYSVKIDWDRGKVTIGDSKLLDVTQWGTCEWTTCNNAYKNSNFCAFSATDNPNFSEVTTMAEMFRNASNANPNTTNWNTGKVTIMNAMFLGATSADPDTSSWNTESLESANEMFRNATNANPDVSNWNTQSLKFAAIMFRGVNSNPDVSNWNTSSLISIGVMFINSPNANPDLSSWDLSQITSADNFALNSNFSTANYEAFLANAAGQTLQPNVAFHAGNAQYNSGTPATNKANIESTYNWTFTDGGQI